MKGLNTFKKLEKLKKKKLIDQVFHNGKSLFFAPLKIISLQVEEEIPLRAQVLITVSKKSFARAVDRNLIKRRIREAYRLNKNELYLQLDKKNINMAIAIVYIGKKIEKYKTIEDAMLAFMKDPFQNKKK